VDRDLIASRTETIGRSPLLALNLKIIRALSVSGSYSTSKTLSWQYNKITGTLQSHTRSSNRTFALTSKYAFSSGTGISLPLFGKLKFKSTMSIDLAVKFNSDISETSSAGGPFVIGSERSNFSVSPVISYRFSSQIRGGVTGRWQDSHDAKFNRRSHTRELQIWAELKF